MPQAAFKRRFHVEHIIARQHGGATSSDNLALACWHCNLKKGPNLSGIDPTTSGTVPLFHPRHHRWSSHFSLRGNRGDAGTSGIVVEGLTPTGRATIHVLGLNDDFRRMLRARLVAEGLFQVLNID